MIPPASSEHHDLLVVLAVAQHNLDGLHPDRTPYVSTVDEWLRAVGRDDEADQWATSETAA